MNEQILSGSPRLLRNLNEKAVLQHLLAKGSLTRMELEAFTALSKPAMSDLLRRLEGAGLAMRDGEKAGTFGPKAGLWSLNPSAAFVAGIDVTIHGIDAAVSDITGRTVGSFHLGCEPGERYDAAERLLEVVQEAARSAGLATKDIDQVVVGLPGVTDNETGHLRNGRQLPNWEGFDIPAALKTALGHRRVLVENDVNLVALEEMAVGAAKGVQTFILFWIGDGVGGAAVIDGQIIRGSTGNAGELGGAMVPDRMAAPGELVQTALVEDLLSHEALDRLVEAHRVPGRDWLEAVRNGASAPEQHREFLDALGYRIAAGLTGAIGILDPDMVVIGGDVGRAGGRVLVQHVREVLAKLPIALPQIVPTAVSDNPVRAGAVELALEHTRERVFTGGSAARSTP